MVCSVWLWHFLVILTYFLVICHARIQKVLSEGIQLWQLFLVMRGERFQISLKAGHHRPTSETNIIKCWFGSFVISQGVRTSFAMKSYFCHFSGCGGGGGGGGLEPPVPPSKSTHVTLLFGHMHGFAWLAILSHRLPNPCLGPLKKISASFLDSKIYLN